MSPISSAIAVDIGLYSAALGRLSLEGGWWEGHVGTELARAQAGMPRNKLFKVGAIVSISV
ncbi:MAG: hypothetical protein GY811_30775 [Myxococcales bacterium]|nr:hypothetical protein [Myxococcales bacterium]